MKGRWNPARFAALASVGAHGALAWVVASTPPAPPRPRPAQVVSVELREPPPPPPAPPQPTPPPRPIRPSIRKVAPPPRAPAAPVAAPPEPAPIVAVPPPVVTGPTAQVELPPAPAPDPRQVNLFDPRALNSFVRRAEPAPEHESGVAMLPGEAAGRTATTEEERVAARIGGATLDLNARSRVQAGVVDTSYTRLGRALLGAWDPDRALPETSAALWAKSRAQNAIVGTKLWLESARNYAAAGTPLAEGEQLEDSEAAHARDFGNPALQVDANRTRETYRNFQRGKFNAAKSAYVLVEQYADRVVASLVQSSGDRDIDQGALEDIRRAAEAIREDLPVATRPRRSLWSLRLQIIINPPVPVGSFTFDEVLEAPKLELPLGRKLLKRVTLEAVYDDDPRLSKGSPGAPEAVPAGLPN